MTSFIKSLRANENGAVAIEYGLILAIIVLGLILALTPIGNSLQNIFNSTSSELDSHTPS